MSTPLSPLSPSRQNTRVGSPVSVSKAECGGIDENIAIADEFPDDTDTNTNTYSSPLKTVVNSAEMDQDQEQERDLGFGHSEHKLLRKDFDVDDEREVEDDVESFAPAPSSPFQFDARDDTVDFQMLRQQRQTSLAASERSTTPQKRSYDAIPEDPDAEEELDERSKKGMYQREEVDVYDDEEGRILDEQSLVESAGQEVGNSMLSDKVHEGMSTVLREEGISEDKENVDDMNNDDDDSHDTMDDTCLSTFSAVPNADMTSFAKLRGESPLKAMRNFQSPEKASTPRSAKPYMKNSLIDFDSPYASPSPRKREAHAMGRGDNLLDLSDQTSFSPRKRYSMQSRYSPRRSPMRNTRDLRSPSKASLIDFDIPPAPTPRSIPTVTPRELESLKSSFMSEISSLKATLSGRDAEVGSLKQAVADAERRVGEALEELRHEAASKEELELEQAEWQRRGQEMEDVLQTVRAEIVDGEREKEQLMKRVEEVEKSKESLEGRIVELESQLAAARNSTSSDSGSAEPRPKTAQETSNEVQDAVEKVARELHTLYKSKHETKVAALKKSYETRWDKRVREAEKKAKAAFEESERMKMERDNAIANAAPPNTSTAENEDHEAEKRVLEAQIKGLQQEMAAVKDGSERLRSDLKMERAEKGELVAAVDEWLAIQQQPEPDRDPQEQQEQDPISPQEYESEHTSQPEPAEDLRRSIGRSGLRPPSTAERKIPKIGAPARHGRGNSGGKENSGSKSGIAVFTPGRSGIMGSIERMGRGA